MKPEILQGQFTSFVIDGLDGKKFKVNLRGEGRPKKELLKEPPQWVWPA